MYFFFFQLVDMPIFNCPTLLHWLFNIVYMLSYIHYPLASHISPIILREKSKKVTRPGLQLSGVALALQGFNSQCPKEGHQRLKSCMISRSWAPSFKWHNLCLYVLYKKILLLIYCYVSVCACIEVCTREQRCLRGREAPDLPEPEMVEHLIRAGSTPNC